MKNDYSVKYGFLHKTNTFLQLILIVYKLSGRVFFYLYKFSKLQAMKNYQSPHPLKVLLINIFILLMCQSCEPWNLKKKEFPICNKPEITITTNVNNLNVSYVLLNEKGPIKKALWNFGDGVTFAQLNAGTHTYAASGTYQVKLEIWNACDESTVYNFSQTVTALPVINTLPAFNSTDKSLELNLQVVSNGGVVISRYGFCLSSTNSNPTIDNSTISSTNINPNISSNYSFSYSNLTAKTKYYYRAFAQNTFGVTYGNVLTANTFPVIGHTQISSVQVSGRANPISFAIGTKLYVGMGKDATGAFKNDLWEYDTKEYTWTAKQSLPDLGRLSAVGFSINGKGYVGLGNSTNGMLRDFWEYNPTSDTWLKKADFPANERWGTFYISNNGLGYVGGGSNGINNYNDFWEYNPNTNQWTAKANLPYYKINGTGFSIDNIMYMGFGQNMTSTSTEGSNGFDFFQFDNNNNRWIQKANIPSDILSDTKYNFSAGGKGYIGRIDKDLPNYIKIYIYNPSNNSWGDRDTALDVFMGSQPRYYGCSAVINNIGYYGFGGSNSYFPSSFWIFRPF